MQHPDADSRPDIRSDPDADSRPDIRSDPDADSRPDTHSDPDADSRSDTHSDPDADSIGPRPRRYASPNDDQQRVVSHLRAATRWQPCLLGIR